MLALTLHKMRALHLTCPQPKQLLAHRRALMPCPSET